MDKTIIARALAGLVGLFLIYIGLRYTFTPDALSGLTALTANDTFGAANIRAMGAPMLAIGLVTVIGAVKSSFEFLVPAPLYFLMLIVTRVVSMATEGTDPSITRATILALVLFIITEVAAQMIKRAKKADA